MSFPVADDGEDDPIGVSAGNSSDSHVIDESHYSHTRRLRAIHNSHDRVLDVRNAVEDRLISGAISEYHARRYYRGAVEAFVMEVMPVLRSDDIQLSTDYAREVELGSVTIRPPEDLVRFARDNIDRMPPGASVPTPVRNHITGVESILTLPSPFTHRFSVTVKEGRDGVQVYSRDVQQELPRDLLDNAVQATTRALEDAQMGLNIGEGRPNNSMGSDGAWPWENDELMPHHVHDAIASGNLTASDLEELMEETDGE